MIFDYNMKGVGFGFGDVLISERLDSSSVLSVKPTDLQAPKNINPDVLVKFCEGGSGFIVKKFDPPLRKKNLFIQGIIVTAAHVITKITLNKYSKKIFSIKVMNKKCYAKPIKCYASVYENLLPSATNGNQYCLPNDFAILALLTSNIINFPVVEFEDKEIAIGESCIIAGYPKEPNYINYACPLAKGNEFHLINNAFHNFKTRVFSRGEVIGINQHVIDLSCSTTNGMSGCPTFTDEGKVCGVYVGGPPLPGQRQLFKAIYCLIKDDYVRAFCLVKDLKQFDHLYSIPIFSNLLNEFECEMIPGILTPKEIEIFEKLGTFDSPPRSIIISRTDLNVQESLVLSCYQAIYKCVCKFKYDGRLMFNISLKISNSIISDIEQEFREMSSGNIKFRKPLNT